MTACLFIIIIIFSMHSKPAIYEIIYPVKEKNYIYVPTATY